MLSSILRRLQGGNLEVFKFGLYIGFPIGWMYYFGTNLEERFSVPDFWPTTANSHKIPADKGEIDKELARMNEQRARRLLEKQRIQKEMENVTASSNTVSTE
ncbi:hypothetical protein McanMca71_002177 [Microsporum canis]|uniref:Mitochondrial cytochrome c oxidase assembly factor n=1 Tax=Arthroderma otae (strain ATCC MYA-4605 / CBS 113480) TaxID=554155 RepID=C5FKV5_ARTOC|nr:mitochondrial cytochrome c oxidase assembly factor [Microsporum canis CBS 113480]EEQ30327.1 mitochondrial cytochrome c oxidase assembly factor [Microsporum canis CBS 113480]